MQIRPLVIAVYDPIWFRKVIEILKKRDVIFYHYYSRDEVPWGSVLYTDYLKFAEEVKPREDVLVIYDPDRGCRALEQAILRARGAEKYGEVVIGVDPGRIASFVVLGDGEYIFHGEGDPGDLLESIEYIVSCIPYDSLIIRIGDRDKGPLLAALLKGELGVKVELVPEELTTPSESLKYEMEYLRRKFKWLRPYRARDIYSAYKIASRKGIEVS